MWKNNYSDARQLFQEYCAKDYPNIVTQKGTHSIDDDETTSVDYLYLQHPESKKLHILISGTHGVEGHAGSAIQFKTLDKIITKTNSQPISYLMIHALNPYGYKNNRRCTKNNIDLNRNYLDANNFNDSDYPHSIFQLVSTYLFSFYFIYLFFRNIFEYGYTKAREYIVKGQYSYDTGLFYGGKTREQNIDVLEDILSIIDYNDFQEIYVFDIHTGLGPYGNLSVMVTDKNTISDLTNLPYNPTTKLINMGEDNIYRNSKGSIVDGIHQYLINKNDKLCVYPIILEYGTFHNLRMFAWLLLENYHYCNKDKENWPRSSQKLKSLFNVENFIWQELVMENYIDFINILT